MTRIFSYVLRFDNGAAPNPYWDTCTLTICKPAIRRTAEWGDWIIGTGSKNSRLKDGNIHDLSNYLVYAMKVTDKMTLADYDRHCKKNLPNKLPDWYNLDFRRRIGDCIYDFSRENPTIRKSVHNEVSRERDLSGQNSLLSINFYYFGEESREIPEYLRQIVKHNQGHRKIENQDLVRSFENWISKFEKNKIYADPQLRFEFDKFPSEEQIIKCSNNHCQDDENETEETIC